MSSAPTTGAMWKLGDFMAVAKAKGLPECKEQTDTIVWKFARFGYHADSEKAVWDRMKGTTVQGDQLGRLMFEAETHAEAAAMVLHSLPDIQAQIINQTVLATSPLPPKKVSLHNVSNALRSNPAAAALVAAMDRLSTSPEFEYIAALVNTTKHRRIIKSQFRISVGQGQPQRMGLQFHAFTYDTQAFPEMWVDDFIGQYEPAMRGYLADIGAELNHYLAALP